MNDISLRGWRVLASAILAGSSGITVGLATIAQGSGKPAIYFAFLLMLSAVLMLPTMWESFCAVLAFPFVFLRNVYRQTTAYADSTWDRKQKR